MNKALKSELVDRYVFFMDDCGTLASCKGDSNEDSILNKLCFALGGVTGEVAVFAYPIISNTLKKNGTYQIFMAIKYVIKKGNLIS